MKLYKIIYTYNLFSLSYDANFKKLKNKYVGTILLIKLINFRKDFSTAWMNLGIVQSALKRYEESEASYFMALQYRSNYPDCYYNLGVLVSTT